MLIRIRISIYQSINLSIYQSINLSIQGMVSRWDLPAHGALPSVPVYLVHNTRAVLWEMPSLHAAAVGSGRPDPGVSDSAGERV